MTWIPVTEIEDDRIAVFRDLKRSNLTRWSGLFIAEGKRVVQRLIESRCGVHSFLVSEHREPDVRAWLPTDKPVYLLPREIAQQLVGYNFHTGILACGVRPPRTSISKVLKDRNRWLLVALPHTTDPENLGQIIRNAAAFGADAVLLGAGSADPYSRRVLRICVGTSFRIPIVECDDLATDLQQLRNATGTKLLAGVLADNAASLNQQLPIERACLIFGNEADGLPDAWVSLADVCLTIPMAGGVDSLNVAAASAVFLHHFAKPNHGSST